jgi:putative MATE family efflux protein
LHAFQAPSTPKRKAEITIHDNYRSLLLKSSLEKERKSSMLFQMEKEPTEREPLLWSLDVENPGDEPSNSNKNDRATTGQKILDLAVPAAGALLIDPLMNLVDTAFVGRFSNAEDAAAPLAGLGSAAALLTFSFYLFNFLCTATTPLVAGKRAAGFTQEAATLGGQVLALAIALGCILTILLIALKQPLLLVMGTGVTGYTANEYALTFLSVRALAAPAILCIEAATGVLRGYLDTKTPIVVLIVANLINLVLDIILIIFAGLSTLGAAIATTTAEWISAGLFLAVLAGRLPSAAPELGSNVEGPVLSIVPARSIPPWDDIRPLIVASSSVFLRTLILQISLSGAAVMAARGGGAEAVAAHQIGIQLWLLGSFFCDSLAAASQGLIAEALGRHNSDDARDVAMTVFLYSCYLGIFLMGLLQLGSSTNVISDIFTNDTGTRSALCKILPLVILQQPLNALVFAADGVIQGASEFPFQAKAMVVSGLTAWATYLVLEAMGADTDTLVHIWTALTALQAMRGLSSFWKLVDVNGPINLLSRKTA